MRDFNFSPGTCVLFQGQKWRLVDAVSLERVQLEHSTLRTKTIAHIADLLPEERAESSRRGVSQISSDSTQNAEALKILEMIRPLLASSRRSRALVSAIAAGHGVSVATVYRALRQWEDHGRSDVLLKGKSSGGRGGSRLSPEVEAIVQSVLPSYLHRQRYSVVDLAREIRIACEAEGLPPAGVKAIRNRLRALGESTVNRRRYGKKFAEKYESRFGNFEEAAYPLAIVEIDHCMLDIVLVDEQHRKTIGRKVWITLAFDVYSRMVVGYYISMDAVGSISTAMCVAHAVSQKTDWLFDHGITSEWPCWGVMDCIHVDNAEEFRGNMLRRGCDRYGIDISLRPVGRPHFGGHIERFFGSFSKEIHKLPGTTFSSVSDRHHYDSEGKACFTFSEIEAYVAKWITQVYHHSYHRGIKTTPIQRYREAFQGPGRRLPPRIIGDARRLQLDFMPFVERTIQRTGVVIDHIRYSDQALERHIGLNDGESKMKRRFLFVRDPRDVSTIFLLDPDDGEYKPISRTDNSKTSATIWELKEANRRLEIEGRSHVDESALFKKVVELRQDALSIAKKNKAARRRVDDLARRKPAAKFVCLDKPDKRDEMFFQQPRADVPFDDRPVSPMYEVEKL